jgi:hypothetical protein
VSADIAPYQDGEGSGGEVRERVVRRCHGLGQ